MEHDHARFEIWKEYSREAQRISTNLWIILGFLVAANTLVISFMGLMLPSKDIPITSLFGLAIFGLALSITAIVIIVKQKIELDSIYRRKRTLEMELEIEGHGYRAVKPTLLLAIFIILIIYYSIVIADLSLATYCTLTPMLKEIPQLSEISRWLPLLKSCLQ